MRGERLLTTVIVLALAAVGCGPSGAVPATVPSSVVSTATPDTATPPLPTTTSSTTVAVPSSVPATTDRRAEIQAIFEDLERRRLDALYRGDREAFAALFANERYLEENLKHWDELSGGFASAPDGAVIQVREVFFDGPDCIAVDLFTDFRSFLGPGTVGHGDVVVQRTNGVWGYAWSGEGWRCIGPHPFS